jgi:hypothetical protein
MANPNYGYRRGVRHPVPMKVDSSTTTGGIKAGDFVFIGTAGYILQAAAGDRPCGVAMQECAVPTADGDLTILVDVSEDSEYEYPPDAGTVTQALCNTTMDVGGAQSINIDASADDIIIVRSVDLNRNTLLVSLIPTFPGVA